MNQTTPVGLDNFADNFLKIKTWLHAGTHAMYALEML